MKKEAKKISLHCPFPDIFSTSEFCLLGLVNYILYMSIDLIFQCNSNVCFVKHLYLLINITFEKRFYSLGKVGKLIALLQKKFVNSRHVVREHILCQTVVGHFKI
jgi:hypothetical protein